MHACNQTSWKFNGLRGTVIEFHFCFHCRSLKLPDQWSPYELIECTLHYFVSTLRRSIDVWAVFSSMMSCPWSHCDNVFSHKSVNRFPPSTATANPICNRRRWYYYSCGSYCSFAERSLVSTYVHESRMQTNCMCEREGNDGSWSTFEIRVGTPQQNARVLPATSWVSLLLTSIWPSIWVIER